MSIGKNIARFRKAKGWTQAELGEKIGVSNQAVSKWESETSMPDVMLLPVLADAFECYIDELFSREVKTEIHYDHCAEFPWADDSVIRGIVCEGRKILQNTPLLEKFTFEIKGDAKNVQSECNISVNGNVSGGCQAKSDIAVFGTVSGGCNSERDITIEGDLSGGCNTGGNIVIGGHCSGACNVGGEFTCGGNLSGDINCGSTITVKGDVEATKIKGDVICNSLKCDKIEGNIKTETETKIKGKPLSIKKIIPFVFLAVAILATFLFLPAEWRYWNDKAEPLPKLIPEEIVFIEAFIYDKNECKIEREDFDKILEHLADAKPTRIPSDSDSVYSKDYRGINIKTQEESYRYFVYQKGQKTFLEIPYKGVYKVDGELFHLLDEHLG